MLLLLVLYRPRGGCNPECHGGVLAAKAGNVIIKLENAEVSGIGGAVREEETPSRHAIWQSWRIRLCHFLHARLHLMMDLISGTGILARMLQIMSSGSEQFRAVPGPSRFCGSQKEYMRLGVLQGCLSICDFSDGDHVDIWLMKDYGVKQSWSKDFYIVKMINETEIYDYYEPIMVLESGLILMLVNQDSLLVYDPGLEHYEDVHIYGIASMFRGIAHVPNLVSLGDVARGENLKEALGFLVSYVLGQKACRPHAFWSRSVNQISGLVIRQLRNQWLINKKIKD
ncbi:hypothetical protein RHGRI_036648 [Rhododendron griersonianum]|uniref:F-box associated domain-containing protein n=1 Tax=Rhododendron griersonianum TaxID=479676 RepID=A0AAV6HSU2_9ERIC|nr:hypothetical protein RHGRI_036648 [Rhododendron griersonianum]